MKKNISYRLGIDLGTNSLGFALVELKNDIPLQPIHMGVRIFSDGRDPKSGSSLAVDRRVARGMRRRRDRLVRRKQQLFDNLIESGLLPKDKMERKKLEERDPYELRTKGLDNKLGPYEIGRAIFHLNQRRGFKSNRKQESKDKDSGAVKEAAKKLEELLIEHNSRTYGEFLAKQNVKRIRNTSDEANKVHYEFYPLRHMLEAEYDLLLGKQSKYHPDILNKDTIDKLKDLVFHQRSLCPVERGKCTVLNSDNEKVHYRAYAALPSSQYFRLLKEINNLKIQDKFVRRNSNNLTEDQRQKSIDYLSKSKEVKFISLAKKIGLKETEKFNLENGGREYIYGLDSAVMLSNKKCFGDLWPSDCLKTQDGIVLQLLEEDERYNENWLKENYPGLSDEQIDNILASTTKLEDGTLRYSSEAIEKLIPQLESKSEEDNSRYKNEYEAVKACGWQYANHYTGEIMMGKLPYYGKLLDKKTQAVKYGSSDEKEYGRIANPTVHVALNQLQKVVNGILNEYGHPKEIAIEFSRELKQTKKEKARRNKENRENADKNRRYDDQIHENGLVPSDDYRLRLKLWEEQDRSCAYSGKKLCISDALSDKAQVDHILPFSKTLDDTNANKVLALRALNQFKGNRTPYQAFYTDRHPDVDWDVLEIRTEQNIPRKKWRFLDKSMERFEEERDSGDAGWQSRQLNDSSYMARVAREYLRYVVGDRKDRYPAIDTYPGGMTAKLREAWGLNSLLHPVTASEELKDTKNRDDHRHHAIDALVIACANRSMLHRISTASGKGEEIGADWTRGIIDNAPPYENYNRNNLQQMVDDIVISHKPDHKTAGDGSGNGTSGRLHEDTFYGLANNQDGIKEDQIRLVTRVAIRDLKEKDIVDICDPVLRQKFVEALYKQNSSNEKPEQIILRVAKENNMRRIRVFNIKSAKAMRAIKDKEGKPYRYVATGGNHHIDIFCPIKDVELSDGRKYKAGQWYAETVTHFDANQKDFRPEWQSGNPSLRRIIRDGKKVVGEAEWKGFATAKLIMRLHINDVVAYDEQEKTEIRRVKKIEGSLDRIYLVEDIIANEQGAKLSWAASANLLQKKNARKISVTPSGKVFDPGVSPQLKCKKGDEVAA